MMTMMMMMMMMIMMTTTTKMKKMKKMMMMIMKIALGVPHNKEGRYTGIANCRHQIFQELYLTIIKQMTHNCRENYITIQLYIHFVICPRQVPRLF
jgi:hypothetical protein